MGGTRHRWAEELARTAGLGLAALFAILLAWGLLVAAGVAALAPRIGTAPALFAAAALHLGIALAAGWRIRRLLRAAEERRRASLARIALLRTALMLAPKPDRPALKPALRHGLAAILALAALALFLTPGKGKTDTKGDGA